MTTSPVMIITDEQIAEIEAACERRFNYPAGDILTLISRLRAAERDAARYQFLRDSGNFSPSAFGNGWALNCGYTRAQPTMLDAAVDAAMKGEKP